MTKPSNVKQRFIGPVVGQGATMKDATAAAMETAVFALHEMDKEPLFGNFRGLVFYARPTSSGAAYGFVITPDKGWAPRDICHLNGDRKAAFVAAAKHAAQYLWNREADDAAFVTDLEEVLRPYSSDAERGNSATSIVDWITWQRKYQAGRDQGMTDNDAFDFAHNRSSLHQAA